MKCLALDLGDVWTGTAISDALGMFARPYETVKTQNLHLFLEELFKKQRIGTVVVGDPQTLKGTESAQTKTITAMKNELEKKFTQQKWVSWDERLTSKQAARIGSKEKGNKKKGDKHKIHSIAAALILESYLMHLQIKSQIT